MDIKYFKTSELKCYDFNNRNHSPEQVDRVAKSIKEFKFNQPIVIDESNVILVGHGRLLAAQKLGLKEVPVVQLKDLTETQKKAYRILDNKLQNDSTWSFDNLELELGFLEDEGFDLESWGLDELKGMFPEDEPEVTDDDFDPSDCENDKTFIKLGDLIELGEHRVLCGDSTNPNQVSELLNGEDPVLMVTDPPYGVNYNPSWRNELANQGILSKGNRQTGEVENDFELDWTEAYKLYSANVCYVWHDGRSSGDIALHLKNSGYEIISQIIWAKPMFALSRGDYHWQHETCLYGVKTGENHNWQGSRSESTLWKIERGCKDKTGHGTEKPIECMARPIRNNSETHDIICDPFLGSGTTLIAADQLNRICYGMEISPKYCQVIIERYKKHCEKNKKPFVCKVNGVEYNPVSEL